VRVRAVESEAGVSARRQGIELGGDPTLPYAKPDQRFKHMLARSDAVAIVPRSLAQAHGQTLGLRIEELSLRLRPIGAQAVRRAHPDAGAPWLLGQSQAAVSSWRA